eukprot:12920772-Prorocentrum_lima.AAC.1
MFTVRAVSRPCDTGGAGQNLEPKPATIVHSGCYVGSSPSANQKHSPQLELGLTNLWMDRASSITTPIPYRSGPKIPHALSLEIAPHNQPVLLEQ